jgi:pyruvate/2-oxoglutarate dehydrogenase complex dihydrolipoamide dehydrogenase (E3) component
VVFEREQEAGGQLISASKPPHKEGLGVWCRWALRQAGKSGIPVKYGITVTPERIASEKPDAVVLAAGALPVVPEIPGIDGAHVFDARDVLLEKVPFSGPAVVLGGGYVGMETMDFLLEKGIAATLLEMQDFPPVGKHTAHGYWLHRRIRKGGGTIVMGAKVTEIHSSSVSFIKDGKVNELSPVNMVVTALGVRPENELGEALTSMGIPFLSAGDVVSPRRIIEAIHEGHRAGLEI